MKNLQPYELEQIERACDRFRNDLTNLTTLDEREMLDSQIASIGGFVGAHEYVLQ